MRFIPDSIRFQFSGSHMNTSTDNLETSSSVSLPSAGILLAGRLRSWREQHDLPIKRAAADLGVSAKTWDHWEKERRFPTMDDLNLLAQYLRLPPCLLLCRLKNNNHCGYCKASGSPPKITNDHALDTSAATKTSSTNCRKSRVENK